MSSKLLRGTFILTIGTFLSKILGLFYVIPFDRIVGEEGTTLYQFAYIPYTIFISIATAGIPLAVSKFISKYNALEEYAVGRRLFKSGLIVMMCTGITAFVILYLMAPVLADMIIVDKNQETNPKDIVTVIRAVSFALIIVPVMSLIRGFFQGHQSMGPSAVSQVIEQIVRIVFLLAGAFIVLEFLNGDIVTAVSVATFAAFIGALGGFGVLLWYWYKRRSSLNDLLEKDKGTVTISLTESYKEILIYALPFVFVGIANPLYQFIDSMTFTRAMVAIDLAEQADRAFGVLNFNTHKLVIIPVSLATAFALTLVPSITKSFVEKDNKSLNRQLNQTFQVLLFLTLPAVVGLSILAEPVYTVFYGHNKYGADVLMAYAPVAILFAYYTVTAAILQGINEQRYTVLSLLVGLLIKLSLNIPLIKLMETEGAVLATALGYTASIIINIFVIRHYTEYPVRLVVRRSLLIIIFTLIMYIFVKAVYAASLFIFSPEHTFSAIILILISAGIGIGVYFYLGMKTRLMNFLFGQKIEKVKQKLKWS